jgi:hypothetical protein
VIALQLTCVAIVALYVAVRLARAPAVERPRFVRRFVLLTAGSWLAENTVIHAYGFYYYDPSWSLFVDQLPLMIVLIWPVVIDSAAVLAGRILGEDSRRAPLLAAAIVLADASLIEPIAVKAGLWRWTEPGLFDVPPIGILGWSIFAAAALAVMASNERARRPGWTDAAILVIGPAVSHVVLVAVWWILFRWINVTVPAWPVVVVAWTLAFGVGALAWRRRLSTRVPLVELLVRVPAAAFFFVLLALHGRDEPALVGYALAFAPPYLALCLPARP